MREIFIDYINSLYQHIPIYIFEILVAVFCIGSILLFKFWSFKKGLRYLSVVLLAEYVFLLLYKTVYVRSFNQNQRYDFRPFWSYTAIQEGKENLLPENIMNVLVFVPIGLLLGCAFRSMKWWKVLMLGGGLSMSIEALQFFYKRGFAETDDVIHNTIGCLVGFGVYKLFQVPWCRTQGRKERDVELCKE